MVRPKVTLGHRVRNSSQGLSVVGVDDGFTLSPKSGCEFDSKTLGTPICELIYVGSSMK